MAARYALERELGHGASATVFLARHLKVPKHVAVKVLNPDIALAVTTERFRREIDNTAPLTHPHILGLTDSGVAYDTQTGREILYYVMPYVEGGSLAGRLSRDGPLAVKEAVRIAWEVADALAYAHARGVIHRDIKPGNILLSEGHAWVADFGIARKLEEEGLTATGRDLGTPLYMSPEQTVTAGVDQRSDIYALGCVLYEMLTGTPPFVGPTSESIALQRLSGPAPSVRLARPKIPVRLERIVAKALAQKAEDRFATAAEFRDALLRPAPIPVLTFAVAAAVVAAGGAGWIAVDRAGRLTAADSLTYAVLPVAYADSAAAERLGAVFHDELAAWTGIKVVDQQKVKEEAPRGAARLTTSEALKAARRLKAGRYIVVDASPLGNAVRVHAVLHDGVSGSPLRERTARLDASPSGIDAAVERLVDGLLFTDSSAAGGTRSFQARQAQERGLAAVREWDLKRADSAFANAGRLDDRSSPALYWLAQVRFWTGASPTTWRSEVERANAGRERLNAHDLGRAEALLAFGRGELPQACELWKGLTRHEPNSFTAWYGLATCLSEDKAVLPDRRSPSGWRFRTSYHSALRAYVRALELQPSIRRGLRTGGFEFVRAHLLTGGNDVRSGRTPESTVFAANPGWQGDSLVLVPFPLSDWSAAQPWITPPTHSLALQHQRELFRDLATAWNVTSPSSSEAKEALALALEMLGEPTCLDTLRRARALATNADARLELAIVEVWTRLKFSIPLDVAGLRAAKALADSVLRAAEEPVPDELVGLASLAALTGRARLAAVLSQRQAEGRLAAGPIARSAPALLAYASLGGPPDSLEALEQRVEEAVARFATTSQQRDARLRWLGRAATIAFPDVRLGSVASLAGTGDYLLDAQAALQNGDTLAVRQILADVSETRKRIAPAELTIDALFPEASLLHEIADQPGAIRWLDPTLSALAATAPRLFVDPARAGTLVRAMGLRAELADAVGDRAAAARWARVVLILLSDSDEFLKPLIRRMERLVR